MQEAFTSFSLVKVREEVQGAEVSPLYLPHSPLPTVSARTGPPTPGPQHRGLLSPLPTPTHLFTTWHQIKTLIKNLLTLPRTDSTQPRTTTHSLTQRPRRAQPSPSSTNTNISERPLKGGRSPCPPPAPQLVLQPLSLHQRENFCAMNG